MIAYLILVHRYPRLFKRMFSAIYDASNHYVIHIDKRSGAELHQEIACFLLDYPNAHLLPSENALWGGLTWWMPNSAVLPRCWSWMPTGIFSST